MTGKLRSFPVISQEHIPVNPNMLREGSVDVSGRTGIW
jgi:hypothetical protein